MEYYVALSSEIDLSPAEIVSAWEMDEQARAQASARIEDTEAETFTPALIAGIVALASTVPVGLLTNALYDVLKSALLRKTRQPARHLKITQFQHAGKTLLTVEYDEKAQ